MFDFAWTEIALIGVVALVAIGPKDLPVAIKAVAAMVKKARRMAGEFQTHVDEMVNLDIKGTIERAVDADGSIRRTMNEDPLKTTVATPDPAPPSEVSGSSFATRDVASLGTYEADPPPVAAKPDEKHDGTPGFIPPAIAHPPVPPAFIPPSAARLAPARAA